MNAEQAWLVEAVTANLADLERGVDEAVHQDLGYAAESVLCRATLCDPVDVSQSGITAISGDMHDYGDELTPEEEDQLDRLDRQGISNFGMSRAEVLAKR